MTRQELELKIAELREPLDSAECPIEPRSLDAALVFELLEEMLNDDSIELEYSHFHRQYYICDPNGDDHNGPTLQEAIALTWIHWKESMTSTSTPG